MGRYYSGDIEGKFWFGVQSSIAADRFGVTHNEPEYVTYHYSEDDLNDVEKEIERIESNLGEKKQKLYDFFNRGALSYNDEQLKEIGISEEDLSEYADLLLGIQIRDCIKEKGECYFEAEF